MKAAFPGSLLVAPVSLAIQLRQQHEKQHQQQRRGGGGSSASSSNVVDVRITPLAGSQDLPGSWPLAVLDLQPVMMMSSSLLVVCLVVVVVALMVMVC